MPNSIDFYGPTLKAERARHHILKLETIFRAHELANRKAMRPKFDRIGRPRANRIGKALPRHTPTILGDAIHNLRAALDHAYCILVEANGGTVDQYVKFPFAGKGTRRDLEGSINGHSKSGRAPSAMVIGYILDVIQPFTGGVGADIMAIHELDIADKHISLIPTTQHVHCERLDLGPFNISGVTLVSHPKTNAGCLIEFPIEQDVEQRVSFEVCFGKGQPLQGEPIIPALKRLHISMREALDGLHRAGTAP